MNYQKISNYTAYASAIFIVMLFVGLLYQDGNLLPILIGYIGFFGVIVTGIINIVLRQVTFK